MRKAATYLTCTLLAFYAGLPLVSARAPLSIDVADGDVAGLVAAIHAANGMPGPDTINLAAGGTYALTVPQDAQNGLPRISDSLTINGNGATIARSSAPGTPEFRILLVWTPGIVTLSSVTITNGKGSGDFPAGAIQLVQGTLNILDSTISNSSAAWGGGIGNYTTGKLNIERSRIVGNVSNDPVQGGSGGGIYNYQGVVTITDSEISGNFARNNGGIFNYQGPMTITGSTIAGNAAASGGGGIGIYEGTLTIFSSTLSGNQAVDGGGINNYRSRLSILNSTFSGNQATRGGGLNFIEGGITDLTHTTITGNAMGLRNTVAANVTLRNCIVALNTGPDVAGTATSLGHNIFGTAVVVAQAGDQFGVTEDQLKLGSLADNGGPTHTVALLSGSVAIDAGDDWVLGAPLTLSVDQRGEPRPVGAHVDAGAFEASAFDVDGPVVSCDTADGFWHGTNISLACTAADEGSGLQNAGDATFLLSTAVPAGVDAPNAATGSYVVCDNAGNCTTAGPIAGNKIDKLAPTAAITAPSAIAYLLNQNVAAAFTCGDGGSGIGSCLGTVSNGAAINTGTVGAHTFSVTATDAVGNTTTEQVGYTVGYGQCLLYDPTKAHKTGSTIPIKLRLCDAAGSNVSSASVPLTATAVHLVSTSAPGTLADSGDANPDHQFRFADGQYIFNLSLKGFGTGTYALVFTVGTDPTPYVVQFQVK